MTIVMVEHVMHAIRSLCGHIVVLDAGRVIAVGHARGGAGPCRT